MLRRLLAKPSGALRAPSVRRVACSNRLALSKLARRGFSRGYPQAVLVQQPEREPKYSNKHVSHPPSFENIGLRCFTQSKLRVAVQHSTYTNFKLSLNDPSVSLSKVEKNEIADALLKWALTMGCTNFAHWYVPMRNRDSRAAPAMKFDGFLSLDYKNPSMLKPLKGEVFTGEQLFQGETDGSSFCNGGARYFNR